MYISAPLWDKNLTHSSCNIHTNKFRAFQQTIQFRQVRHRVNKISRLKIAYTVNNR